MIDSVLLNGWLEVADVSFPLAIGNIELLENLSNKYYILRWRVGCRSEIDSNQHNKWES